MPASCTVIFVQEDKLTLLQSVSLSRIRLRSGMAQSSPGGRRPLRPSSQMRPWGVSGEWWVGGRRLPTLMSTKDGGVLSAVPRSSCYNAVFWC